LRAFAPHDVVHFAAFVDDQVMTEVLFEVMDVGSAEIVTFGSEILFVIRLSMTLLSLIVESAKDTAGQTKINNVVSKNLILFISFTI